MDKKQSFIKGAMILAVANAISKILGAVFKIPLTYILKEEGMGIFNTAFSVYIMILAFIVSGMPLAISKMIAEQLALGKKSSVRKIMRVSVCLLSVVGIVGTLIMYFGADIFARIMNDTKSVYAIKLISPSIFFVALGVAYKSYYQGSQNMMPTAVSQVIESIIKLLVGYFFASTLARYAIEITSGGAILGVTIGEVVATFILILMYHPQKCAKDKISISNREIVKNIFAIALPMIFASSISGVVSFIDVALIRTQLQKVIFTPKTVIPFLTQYASYTNIFDNLQTTLKITADGARWLYGSYSGYALTIFHLPIGIMFSLCVSIVPVIAGAMALGNKKSAEHTMELAIRITMLITLPCAVIMYVFAEPILDILFHNTASALLLKTVSPCVVMICISQLCIASLQASGKIMLPFYYALVCSIIKLLGNYFLIPIACLNIQGAVISSNLCYFVEMIFSLYFARKYFGVCCNMGSMVLKPIVSTIIMGVVMALVYTPMCIIFVKEIIALGATLILGGCTYILMIMMTNAVTMREIMVLKKRI